MLLLFERGGRVGMLLLFERGGRVGMLLLLCCRC